MRPRIRAIIGARGSGKTGRALELVAELKREGLRVGGFVQPVIYQDDRRVGYELLELESGLRSTFARRRSSRAPCELGFDFDPGGWTRASLLIREGRRSCDVLVVDEMGRLEATGGGHMVALLEPLSQERALSWLLCVREGCAGKIERALGGFDEIIELSACETP